MKDKLCQLFVIAFCCFDVANMVSVLGTTMPDLQCLFHAHLDKVSSLFLPMGITMGVACLVSPVLIKKFNIFLLMATWLFLYFCGAAVVALTPFIEVAIVGLLFAGFSMGALTLGSLHLCHVLFPGNPYAFHVTCFATAAGNFFSPILAIPFLCTTLENVTTLQEYTTEMSTSVKLQSETVAFQKEPNSHFLNKSDNYSMDIPSCCDNSSSRVTYLYIIIGSFALPLTVAFLSFFCVKDIEFVRAASSNDAYKQMDDSRSKCDITFTALLVLFCASICSVPYVYGGYLTTAGNEGPMYLGVQKMSLLTSIFWLHVTLGRMASTAVSIFLRQVVILYVCLTGEALTLVLLAVTESSEICLWIGSLSLGFFSGPLMAAMLAWGREYTNFTPLVLGLLALADLCGITFLSFIAGQLINSYGVKSKDYFCLVLSLFQLVLFCILHMFGSVMNVDPKRIQNEAGQSEVTLTTDMTEKSYTPAE